MRTKNKQKWFEQARFGMFIHWGIYSIPGLGEWTLFNDDWDFGEYEKFAEQFNPVDFKPEEWAKVAWEAGMRYVVFTTKHHDGFCMFDSKYTNYKITNTPYAKDITAELVIAFRARGIKIGFYHSLVDWRHPHFIPDAEHPLWKRGECDFSQRNLKIYQEYLYNTVEQLMTDYGKIDIMFFDYTSKYKDSSEWEPAKLLEMIYRLQPEIMVNDRLSFDKKSFQGDYLTPEISVPNAPLKLDGFPALWETCMTMNQNWGYYREDSNYKSLNSILTGLMGCISKNGNLLLNVGPDEKGLIPLKSQEVMNKLAEWFAIHQEAVYGTGMSEYQAPDGYLYTQKDNCIYLYLPVPPIGDIILPQLNGKIEKLELMRTSKELEQVTYWGYELIGEDEIRIRPTGCITTDVIKITLS